MKPQTANPRRPAISYIRFSSGKQQHGFSLDRQLEGTKEFCRRHNLQLDEKLSFSDLGLSAFKGKNAASGKLSVFLEAVRQKKIRKGTVLVVEALDRLTRDTVVAASHLLTEILLSGVDVGIVTEDKVYSRDYINTNPFEFIVAVTYLIRGGNESEMKSVRVKDAWTRKKKMIAEGKGAVKIPCPCWIERDGDKWRIVEERANVVRRIYRDYLKGGLGIWSIAQKLNQENVPPITQRGPKRRVYHRVLIHRLLRDQSVMGTYTNTDPPVADYFPPIVPVKDFYAVQAKLKDRRQFRGRHSLNDISLFKGVCKCGKCGGTMTRVTRTRTKKNGGTTLYRYLYCHNSHLGKCLPAISVDLTKLETAFLRYTAGSSTAFAFFSEPDDKRGNIAEELSALEGQLAEKQERRTRLVELTESGGASNLPTVVTRLTELGKEIKTLESALDSTKAELNRTGASHASISEYQKLVLSRKVLAVDDRLRLRELIRQFCVTMTLYPQEKRAAFTTVAGKMRELNWSDPDLEETARRDVLNEKPKLTRQAK